MHWKKFYSVINSVWFKKTKTKKNKTMIFRWILKELLHFKFYLMMNLHNTFWLICFMIQLKQVGF